MTEKKQKRILNDWWRQFLTGVMGTAIGVGLTFAVSNWVDGNKKAQIQRQTAMMAVYDIDEIIRELKEDFQREEALYPIAFYLSTHPERVDAVSGDTVQQAVAYLIEEPTSIPDWAADTKEKAFTSSLDAWRNLENSRFYDNVQRCYQRRAELFRIVDKDVVFHRPLTDEAVNKFVENSSAEDLEYDGSLSFEALRKLLKQTIDKPETIRFLRMYLLRSRLFNQYIDELTRLNKESKFLMSITDDEMEAYVRKNIQKIKPAKPALMAGVWEEEMNEGREILRFGADNTLEISFEMIDMASLRVEEEDLDVQLKVPVSYCLRGEWTLERDSVRLYCLPGKGEILSFDLDLTGLPESVQEQGRVWEKAYRERLEQYLETASIDQWYSIYFDITGDLMFLSYQYNSPTGETTPVRLQLTRKPE